VLVRTGLDGSYSGLAGLRELRAPESNAASLGSRKGLTGSGRYQGAPVVLDVVGRRERPADTRRII
jgi:hypothetical protein